MLLLEKNKSRDDDDLSESKALEARCAARFTSVSAEPLLVRVGGFARVESSIGRSAVAPAALCSIPSSSGTTLLEDEPRRRGLASSKVSFTPVATTIVTVALRRLGGSGSTRRRGGLRCLGG